MHAVGINARNKFDVGDRVRENSRAPRSRRRVQDDVFREGTVVGFSRNRAPDPSDCVRVKFDNFKTTESLHADFLDKVL